MFAALVRVIRGPTAADRIVAADLLATLGVGLIGVHAVVFDRPVHLATALVLGLIAFMGTVAFARYIERRAKSGHLGPVGSPVVAARFVIEAVVWFARHCIIATDPETLPDEATVREEVVRRIVASFAP